MPDLCGTTGKESFGILLSNGQIWYLPGQARINLDPFFQETSWKICMFVHLYLQKSLNKQPINCYEYVSWWDVATPEALHWKRSQRWDKRCKGKNYMRLRREAVLQELARIWEKGEQRRKSQWEEMDIRTTKPFISGFTMITVWSPSKDTALLCSFGMFWLEFCKRAVF